jgi:hypothetical protein
MHILRVFVSPCEKINKILVLPMVIYLYLYFSVSLCALCGKNKNRLLLTRPVLGVDTDADSEIDSDNI